MFYYATLDLQNNIETAPQMWKKKTFLELFEFETADKWWPRPSFLATQQRCHLNIIYLYSV